MHKCMYAHMSVRTHVQAGRTHGTKAGMLVVWHALYMQALFHFQRKKAIYTFQWICRWTYVASSSPSCMCTCCIISKIQVKGARGFSSSRPKDKYAASQSRARHLHALPTITAFGFEHLVGYTTMSTKCSPDEKPVVWSTSCIAKVLFVGTSTRADCLRCIFITPVSKSTRGAHRKIPGLCCV